MRYVDPRRATILAGLILGLASPSLGAQWVDAPPAPEAKTPESKPPVVQEPPPDPNPKPDPTPNELADLSLEELMDVVVVTASRREQNIKTVPYAVSVITAEDIRRSGARSIPDALRLAPGVDVAQLHYGNSAVSVRGLHGLLSNQTLVLVDGRQIYDALYGGTTWGPWSFALEDVERIEVVRGPGGVTWGPDAVNGVINIITKDPLEQEGLTLGLMAGSRGTHREYVGYGKRQDDWRYRVSAEYEMSDGFREGGSWLNPLNDRYLAARLGAKAIHEKDKGERLTLSAGSTLVDGGLSPAIFSSYVGRSPDSQASFVLGRWHEDSGDGEALNITGYVNDLYLDSGRDSTEYRYQQIGLLLDRTVRWKADHLLSFGLDSRLDLFDASLADPQLLSRSHVTSGRLGAHLQDDWQLAPRWLLSGGARLDYDSYGGFEPSARLALGYQVNDSSFLYSSLSRAAHFTPAALRFLDTPLLGNLVRGTAARGMKANDLLAYEVGYRGRIGKRFDHSAAVYWHEYSDIFYLHPRLGPPGLFQLEADNGADPSSYGFEWEGRFRATDRLTFLGNYTFENLDSAFGVPMQVSADLISALEHKFMFGTQYSATDDVRLSSYLYFVDEVYSPNPRFPILPKKVDAYFRWDVRLERDLWKDSASVAIGVQNLLDSNQFQGASAFLTGGEVPRMLYVEFRATIK